MDYMRKVQQKSRNLLDSDELAAIEAEHPQGMSAAEIVAVFSGRGIKLSEATFRKYVQLGLLPRSRRVGSKGKHRGSRGIYPIGTLRQINEIKRLMSLDYTIEEITQQFAFVGGEIEELRRQVEGILDRLEKSIAADGRGDLAAEGMRRELQEARKLAHEMVRRLESAAERIREQAQIARDAV